MAGHSMMIFSCHAHTNPPRYLPTQRTMKLIQLMRVSAGLPDIVLAILDRPREGLASSLAAL
jgi:hypothetical protein